LVTLDGNHALGAKRQQRPGESAGTRADLQHRHARKRARRPADAGCEIEVEQKVLAERFLGDETVAANDVA
jgi:hypothetical protein